MPEEMLWPDPVPCRPENPVQGIRRCEALQTGTRCRWLGVRYCGVRTDDMADALMLLGLDEFTWLVEDDVEAQDLEDALPDLVAALNQVAAVSQRQQDALRSIRWLVGLLRAANRYGCGLSGRFAERLEGRDRY